VDPAFGEIVATVGAATTGVGADGLLPSQAHVNIARPAVARTEARFRVVMPVSLSLRITNAGVVTGDGPPAERTDPADKARIDETEFRDFAWE
jgi:hypothetical protein